jgi:hypothetical protein
LLDDELRRRLGRRFGAEADTFLDELPPVLDELASRWELHYESLIQRGTTSVVIRCNAAGRRAVLKVSPRKKRVLDEAVALARWNTRHVPEVLAVEESIGALLIEAIEPARRSTCRRAIPAWGAWPRSSARCTRRRADPAYETVAERTGISSSQGAATTRAGPIWSR